MTFTISILTLQKTVSETVKRNTSSLSKHICNAIKKGQSSSHFYRKRGEKATVINDGESTLKLKYGDIIITPETYRGTMTKIALQNSKSKKVYIISAYDNEVEGVVIDSDISKYIEDPFDFYSKSHIDKLYEGICQIEFDFYVHKKILPLTVIKKLKEMRKNGEKYETIWWSPPIGWGIDSYEIEE